MGAPWEHGFNPGASLPSQRAVGTDLPARTIGRQPADASGRHLRRLAAAAGAAADTLATWHNKAAAAVYKNVGHLRHQPVPKV